MKFQQKFIKILLTTSFVLCVMCPKLSFAMEDKEPHESKIPSKSICLAKPVQPQSEDLKAEEYIKAQKNVRIVHTLTFTADSNQSIAISETGYVGDKPYQSFRVSKPDENGRFKFKLRPGESMEDSSKRYIDEWEAHRKAMKKAKRLEKEERKRKREEASNTEKKVSNVSTIKTENKKQKSNE